MNEIVPSPRVLARVITPSPRLRNVLSLRPVRFVRLQAGPSDIYVICKVQGSGGLRDPPQCEQLLSALASDQRERSGSAFGRSRHDPSGGPGGGRSLPIPGPPSSPPLR